jgi:hypothetical protein
MLERRRPLMRAWSDFVCGKNDANVVALSDKRERVVRGPLRRA